MKIFLKRTRDDDCYFIDECGRRVCERLVDYIPCGKEAKSYAFEEEHGGCTKWYCDDCTQFFRMQGTLLTERYIV